MSETKGTTPPKSSKLNVDWKEIGVQVAVMITTAALTGFCTAAGTAIYHRTMGRSQKDNLLVLPGGKTGTHG